MTAKLLTETCKTVVLKLCSTFKNHLFQWVPSHVNACGNEIADGLVREGSHKYFVQGGCLAFSEIATRVKVFSSWKDPAYEWHEGNHPCAVLLGTGSRRDETTLARFQSIEVSNIV
ncbi:RNase H domain-containing protein [Trichonephila clavipes]|nr:RNase H domain-containing protein [Trichonephila clavipes]